MPIFLTWNLKGAFPHRAVTIIEQARKRLESEPPRANESRTARKVRQDKTLFAIQDRLMDEATEGPMHLRDPQAAQVVVDAILFGVPARYALYAFVVKANHVHAVLRPALSLDKITQGNQGLHGLPDKHDSKEPRASVLAG